MIECASWSGHHNIHSAFECDELGTNRLASIDGEYGNALFFAIAMNGFAYLYRQFACRYENEGERV